jgi:hypothetical protein
MATCFVYVFFVFSWQFFFSKKSWPQKTQKTRKKRGGDATGGQPASAIDSTKLTVNSRCNQN